jgi:hypothetical protein
VDGAWPLCRRWCYLKDCQKSEEWHHVRCANPPPPRGARSVIQFKRFLASPTCSAQRDAGTRCLNAPRHPTPSKRAAQPPSKRSGHLGKSTPGLQATGWWAGTPRQNLISRTRTSQASTCDASEAAGLTSEDRRSTTAVPTSRGCRSRSTAAVLRGRQPPRGVGQLRLRPTLIRPASGGSGSGWPPAFSHLGLLASVFCLAGHCLPCLGRPLPCLCLPHRSPRHRQAQDHKDVPHISFADDSLACWQERVPEPQGQEPPGHEDVARLKRPLFAHAQRLTVRWASSIGPAGMWVWRLERVECQPAAISPQRRGSSEDSAAGVVMSVGHSAVTCERTLLLELDSWCGSG